MKARCSESMPGESKGNLPWVLILPQLAVAPDQESRWRDPLLSLVPHPFPPLSLNAHLVTVLL